MGGLTTAEAPSVFSPSAEPAKRKPFSHTPVRLFVTCWLVYSLHVATNTVREIYPALAIADHLSFRVDEYAGLHPDLFEKPGYGWHINSNPGSSMVAAVPYSMLAPVVNRVAERVTAGRAGQTAPEYDSPWPMAREFYKQAWQRGYDVKFGFAALIMQVLCMAPLSALAAVAMYKLLLSFIGSGRIALGLTLLYAFGTPVFFRTGYLNQNGLVTDCVVFALAALMTCKGELPVQRILLAGAAGGAAILFDYSGVMVLLPVLAYAGLLGGVCEPAAIVRRTATAVVGALPPLALLWFYQWQSFGNPFLPAQHWMPRIAYTDIGFNGVGLPSVSLGLANLFDGRFGLFTSAPVLLLAFAWPFVPFGRFGITRAQAVFAAAAAAGIWLFSSSVGYAWLQFNTGVRYLVPAVPFLFLLIAPVLLRLPRLAAFLIAVLAVTQAWSMAMYRDVERGLGVLEPLLHVFIGGFQLPFLTVLSRVGSGYGDHAARGVSPLPLFVLCAALIWVIWKVGPKSEVSSRYE